MVDERLSLHIHKAVVRGDISEIRDAYGDPDGFPNSVGPLAIGDSLLVYAIYHGSLRLVEELIAMGADVNPEVLDGFPPLVAVMATDRLDKCELLRLLSLAGSKVNVPGVNGQAALSWAIAQDDVEAVETLLELGADPHLRCEIDEQQTPLEEARIRAAETGFSAVVSLLESYETREG